MALPSGPLGPEDLLGDPDLPDPLRLVEDGGLTAPPGHSLSDAEGFVTRIYLAILRQEHPTRGLLVAQGMPAEMVDHGLAVLAARRFITLHSDGGWEVHPPEVALPAHAQELETRARVARASAHELAQVFHSARTSGWASSEGVRVLRSLDDLHSATAELVSAGREWLLSMRDPSPRTEVLFKAPMTAHRDRIISSEGIALRNRAVFDVRVLDFPDADAVLHARATSGEKAKFAAGVPFSAVVVDDIGAVVDVSSYDRSGQGSLVVTSRPLVHALTVLLESFWRRGMPLDRVTESGLDRRDVTILSLLAAGASDTTIARQARISQRTVERRVRTLMDRLEASTRFQAGVQAAKRGWL